MSLPLTKSSTLIAPYGNELVDLMVPPESYAELKDYASQLPSLQISPRAASDLELLSNGAFSPLKSFMGQDDFHTVVNKMRLAEGYIFPIPITLPVEANANLHLDQDIALRNNEYELLAVMTVNEIYEWDRNEFAEKVIGTRDLRHPLATELQSWGKLNLSGRLQVLHQPRHYDFRKLWLSPAHTRAKLAEIGQKNVVAFQPLDSLKQMENGLVEQILKTRIENGVLLFHPTVGLTRLGDINHYTRIRIYSALAEQYPEPDQFLLALLPLATRMAGPREALWQALIRRNYGANHMIVSRDHASPVNLSEHTSFYKPEEAQQLVENYSQELGVKMIPEQNRDEGTSDKRAGLLTFSGIDPQISSHPSNNGYKPPELSIQPEGADILAEIHRPRHRQGVCIWFTGLSGSGKSTTAEMLTWMLLEHGRRVTVLDGDVVRTHLSKGLGFSKADRDTNVRRIGFVASELVQLGGTVICAVVSPYQAARNDVRNMVGSDQFVEVYVDTPLQVCEARDVKGFYAKARRGELKGFTGIDDPYEPPDRAEITLDTTLYTPLDNAGFIIDFLAQQGFIRNGQKQI